MKYRNTIIALGFVVLLASTSLIGVPQAWKGYAIVAAAVAIVVLAYFAGKEPKVGSDSGIQQ